MATESLSFKIGCDTSAFRSQMAGAIKTLGTLTAAFTAVRAVVDGFSDAINLGGRLDDLSSRTGETAGSLYVLERAFGNAGVGAEKLGPSLNMLQKKVEEGSDAFDALGISAADLRGKLPTEQLAIIARRIEAIEDPGQRAAVAMAIFGRVGGELLPVLRNYSSEMATAEKQTGSMKRILDESAKSLDNMGDQLGAFAAKRTEFFTGFTSQVSDAFNTAAESFEVDTARIGEVLGSMWVNGPIVGAMKQFRDTAEEAKTIIQETADAADPLVTVGEKFRGLIIEASDALKVALGQQSLIGSLMGEQSKPWKKPGYEGMLGAENYRPGWDDVDFSEENQRVKNMANETRLRRAREAKAAARREKDAEALAAKSGSGGSSGPTGGMEKPRADITGATYDKNAVYGGKTKEEFQGGKSAIDQPISPYGYNPDGSPRTQREFETGKQEAVEKAAEKGDMEGKKAAGEKGGRGDPIAQLVDAVSKIQAAVEKIEPKLPQHITA